MPSPFPGMDPYLENPADWLSFHSAFLIDLQRAILAHVRHDYRVTVEQKLCVQRDDDDGRVLFARADAGLTGRPRRPPPGGGVAVVPAPTTGRIPVPAAERIPRRWLTIRDKRGRQVVTVVEVLSPTDKRLSPDRENYLAKRAKLLRSSAGLVEIDLLRDGHRTPVEGRPVCDYCAVVSRAAGRRRLGLGPARPDAGDPLPTPTGRAGAASVPAGGVGPVLRRQLARRRSVRRAARTTPVGLRLGLGRRHRQAAFTSARAQAAAPMNPASAPSWAYRTCTLLAG